MRRIDPYEFLAKRILTYLRADMKRKLRRMDSPTLTDGMAVLWDNIDEDLFDTLCSVGSSANAGNEDYCAIEFARRCLKEIKKR